MKEGIYIRVLPFTGEYRFYLYRNSVLLCLDTTAGNDDYIDWHKSMHDKPTRESGFEYILELSE